MFWMSAQGPLSCRSGARLARSTDRSRGSCPERIMRQGAGRITHERLRLKYQIALAPAFRRSNVGAAQGGCLGAGAGRSGRRFQTVRQFAAFQQSRQRFPDFFGCGAKALLPAFLDIARATVILVLRLDARFGQADTFAAAPRTVCFNGPYTISPLPLNPMPSSTAATAATQAVVFQFCVVFGPPKGMSVSTGTALDGSCGL